MAPLRTVDRFEAELLRVLQGLLGRAPLAPLLVSLAESRQRPRCLSRDAVALVEDRLAKGLLAFLCRAGGWRRERFVRGESIREGRLWERHEPARLGLTFSRHSLDFLLWATAAPVGVERGEWRPQSGTGPGAGESTGLGSTLGDRLLGLVALHTLRGVELGRRWCRFLPPVDDGLSQLAFPDLHAAGGTAAPPDFSPWLVEPGPAILESLQPLLARRWHEVERAKGTIGDLELLRRLGRHQERALEAYLTAINSAERRDLARFLLDVGARLAAEGAPASRWVGRVDLGALRLAERGEVYRETLALPRALQSLAEWQRQARGVGFTDEGYAAAQLWKQDWERFQGDTTCAAAERLVRSLDPLG